MVYDSLLVKTPSKWSKRQFNLFIRLLVSLEKTGPEMADILNSLGLKTPRGLDWNASKIFPYHSKIQRISRDEKKKKSFQDILNKIINSPVQLSLPAVEESPSRKAAKSVPKAGLYELICEVVGSDLRPEVKKIAVEALMKTGSL